jgi:hypothetical protein
MPMRQEVRPSIDIAGSIGGLGDALQQGMEFGQKRRVDRATRAALAQGLTMGPDGLPDYMSAAGNILSGGGDTDTALTLARLAEAQNERQWQHSQPIYRQGADGGLYDMNPRSPTYSGGTGSSQPQPQPRQRQAPPVPDDPGDLGGYEPTADTAQPAPVPDADQPTQTADASQPEMQPVIPGKKPPRRLFKMPDGSVIDQDTNEVVSPAQKQKLSPTDKKAIIEADDAVKANQAVIGMLDQALVLNKKALSGIGAQQRGYAGSVLPDALLPGSKQAAIDTENLNNLVTQQALTQLRTVFGGNPTEGERQVLLDIQGSVNQAPEVREEIYKRARTLAATRLATNRERAAAIRNRTYFESGGEDLTAGPAADEPEQQDNPQEEAAEPQQQEEGQIVTMGDGRRFRLMPDGTVLQLD